MKKTKNTIIENIKIEKVGFNGIGVGNLPNGKKVIVNGGVLPGSIVDCKTTRTKKDYVECKVWKIKKLDSNLQISNKICPHYFLDIQQNSKSDIEINDDYLNYKKGCGGCKWQVMNYTDQLELKKQIVKDSFRNIKDIFENIYCEDIIGSPLEFGYRNKIEFSFGKYMVKNLSETQVQNDAESAGKSIFSVHQTWNVGFHKQGEFAKIVDIDSCFLISEKANKIYVYIKNLLYNSNLPVYDQKTHYGILRHLVIRQGVNTDQILVNLVISDSLLKEKTYKKYWDNTIEQIKTDDFIKANVNSFVITHNNGLADIVKGEDISVENLIGEGYIYEKLSIGGSDITFRISPFSFFQTNTVGASLLFSKAFEMLGDVGGVLLDLYCGAGTIGLSFLKSKICEKIIGIEVVQEAIYDAKFNAQINVLDSNSYFVAGKAEDLIFQDPYIKENLFDIKSIVVDPPREGLHKKVVDFLINLKKQIDFKLLYISCNPVTMARDVELLISGGFSLKKIQSVDMFPHTHHIENIGLLI